MLCRKAIQWEQTVLDMQLHWGLERGAQPRSSLATLFGLTCELFGARTLKIKKQRRLLALWVALWDIALARAPVASTATDGPIASSSADGPVASTSTDGPVASTATGCIQIAWRGKLTERSKQQLLSRLPHQVHQCVDRILGAVGDSCPSLILAIARCAFLRPYYRDECLFVAGELARDFIGLIEWIFLQDATTLLVPDLPAGAPERYSYGRRKTRKDPRQQATW